MVARIRKTLSSKPKYFWSRFTSGIFGRGAISFLVATASINVSNFLFHIFVSRLLGPANYGVVGALLGLLSLIAVPVGAAQLAVTQAVITKKADDQLFSLGSVTLRALVGSLIAMLALGSLSPVIDGFLHIPSPLPVLLLSTWIPLATVSAVLQGGLIGEYRFRAVAFATFFGGGPMRLLLGIGMVLAGFGVVGAIAATILGQTFTTGSLLFSARRELGNHTPHPPIRIKTRDMTLSVASLASFTTLVGIDTFLARHFFSSTLAGEYSAGAVAAHIALFVPGVIVTIAFPHLVQGKGTAGQSRKAFREALTTAFILSVAVATSLTVLSSLVVRLLFGSSYAHAVTIVGLLSFASATTGILSIFVYFHLARGSLFALAPWLGVILATSLISIQHQTMTSVAATMLIVSVITLVLAGVPALRALVIAASKDSMNKHSWVEFPPTELDFTLVVPFYNPGPRFGKHIADVLEILAESGLTFEILAVSDGSTDHSEDQLTTLISDRLELLRLDRNEGKGAALRAGLRRGRGEYLGFIDGDGDLPASLIKICLEIIRRDCPDVVFGSKRHPQSQVLYPPLRRVYSWGYQQLNRVLFHLPVRDTQTGIKVVRRDVLIEVLPRMEEKRFAFDLELFVVARQRGFRKLVEMPVSIGERFSSTISLRSVQNMLLDTFAIFYRLRILRSYDREDWAVSHESEFDLPVSETNIGEQNL